MENIESINLYYNSPKNLKNFVRDKESIENTKIRKNLP